MKTYKKQTFIQGIITLLFSQVLIKILGLIYKLYLTNKQGFGDSGNAIYSSGFQIYALLLTISSVGVPNAISKLISEKLSIGDEKNANRIFKIAFIIFAFIGFVSSVLLYFSAKYIAVNIIEIPEAELTLQVLSPSIFFVTVISVFRGYFNAQNNMKPTAYSQTLEQLIKTIFTIGIVEYICMYINVDNKTEIMAAGANLATTIATIISYIYLFICYKNYKVIKINNKEFKKDKIDKIIKNIFIVSMPITISVVLGTINKNIDSITVVRGLKSFMSAEDAKIQYGILSGKVDTLVTLPMSLNTALVTSLVPAISSAKARNNIKEVKNKIKFSLIITFIVGILASFIIIVFAGNILQILFPNASSGKFILQISAISIFFVLMNQTINGILQGFGKQIVPVISLLIGVIIKLIINLSLVHINPNYCILGGTAGAAFGTVMCYAISMIINMYYLFNKMLKKWIHFDKFVL